MRREFEQLWKEAQDAVRKEERARELKQQRKNEWKQFFQNPVDIIPNRPPRYIIRYNR